MKCPKCGYLGFETSERCRNCGYDFSLAVEIGPPEDELPLQSGGGGAGAPLADLNLSEVETSRTNEDADRLDLDRVIGDPRPGALPLFGGDDDTPLITVPRPLRPPLSVRRTTPEIPRVRPRPHQSPAKPEDGELTFHLDSDLAAPEAPADPGAAPAVAVVPASRTARLAAAIVDALLLSAINLGVVYLTLALTGLTWESYAVLPLAPLVGFLAILNGGYLTVFIAAAGQTIGKMLTGVRVTRDDGQRVDIAGAVLRTVGCAVSLLTLGFGYLPAFFAADRRALQDRIAGTQVVRGR
jgi:uncharacterized RDD family membrane protein YckC